MELDYAGSSAHQPFFCPGGRGAALLIHGFPGSPAEMRPLSKVIHARGWTTQGLLLPGLGAQIAQLERHRNSDWTEAVTRALAELRRSHSPIVLIGYSVGGSLALHAAVHQRVEAVVLLAPFWRMSSCWVDLVWPVIARMRPRIQLMKQLDFSAPEVRATLQRMFGAIDLDDPSVQERIRGLSLPARSISEVRELGRRAFRGAAKLNLPITAIQGSRDPVALPARTQHLLRRLPSGTRYHEVDAGHDLINPEAPSWAAISHHVTNFLDAIPAQNQVS